MIKIMSRVAGSAFGGKKLISKIVLAAMLIMPLAAVLPAGAIAAVGPALTAVAHNENAKTITLTWNQPVHFETEHGNISTPVSPAILNIFSATWNSVTSDWDYDLSTIAPGVTITGAAFDGTNTILTVTYSGTLANGNYVVDSWVADSPPGSGNGGYDIKNGAGTVDVTGVSPAFNITHPALIAVAHNEVAKTITLTWNQPVHFETEWGNVPVVVGDIHSILNIFSSTPSGDYNLGTIAPGATITGAAFDTGTNTGTVLTVTYTGTLANGDYVVDSWTTAGGWDIKNATGTVDVDGVSPVFTVTTTSPALAAEDFGVAIFSGVRGYTAGFGLTNATLADVQSVVVRLYSGTTLLQTNTSTGKMVTDYPTYASFSGPFDVSGTFNYALDGYWTNVKVAGAYCNLPATSVVATVTLLDSTVLTATNSTLTGDPTTIYPATCVVPPPPPTPPTNMNQCKKDGYKTFTNPTFKNQGQCVSYVQANPKAGKK